MAQTRLLQWLRLIRTPGLGPARIHRMLERFEDAAEILKTPLARLQKIPGIGPVTAARLAAAPSLETAQSELTQLTALAIRVVPVTDPLYPPLLLQITNPPPVLFVQGDPQAMVATWPVAIVGSRHPTRRGLDMARRLARDLARRQVVVVSGFAEGIDGAAHQGALEGGGTTVGVAATGLDIPYPRSHGPLRQRILQKGCMISESPLGTPPAPHLFPARNRIISGLCRAVLVVEATTESGSLITARLALEQGREVFAVPGPANAPLSQGPHTLLKQGAGLVENADELMEALAWETPDYRPTLPNDTLQHLLGERPGEKISQILHLLQAGPVQCDELLRVCRLTVGELSSILLQLELAGVLERLPGDHVSLRIP